MDPGLDRDILGIIRNEMDPGLDRDILGIIRNEMEPGLDRVYLVQSLIKWTLD